VRGPVGTAVKRGTGAEPWCGDDDCMPSPGEPRRARAAAGRRGGIVPAGPGAWS